MGFGGLDNLLQEYHTGKKSVSRFSSLEFKTQEEVETKNKNILTVYQ